MDWNALGRGKTSKQLVHPMLKAVQRIGALAKFHLEGQVAQAGLAHAVMPAKYDVTHPH